MSDSDDDLFSYGEKFSFGDLEPRSLSKADTIVGSKAISFSSVSVHAEETKKRKRQVRSEAKYQASKRQKVGDGSGVAASSSTASELSSSSSSASSSASGLSRLVTLEIDEDDDDLVVLAAAPAPSAIESSATLKRKQLLQRMRETRDQSRHSSVAQAAELSPSKASPQPQRTPRIVFANTFEKGKDTTIPINLGLPMSEALKRYCDIFGVDPSRYLMKVFGMTVDGTQTAEYYRLEDMNKVQLFPSPDIYVLDAEAELAEESGGLHLKLQGKPGTAEFDIAPNKPLVSLLPLYAEKVGVDEHTLVLSFDGELLTAATTAVELDLEDDDMLDVRVKK